MNKTVLLILLTAFIFSNTVSAQEGSGDLFKTYDMASIGIGGGLDYGGLGANGQWYANKRVGAFLGLGYNVIGLGYNVGLKYRFISEKPKGSVIGFVTAMYGYNGVIKVSSYNSSALSSYAFSYQKVYYGPSFGVGLDTKRYGYKKGYWSFVLLFPIRSQDYQDEINYLKAKGVTFRTPSLPLSASVGYKFILD